MRVSTPDRAGHATHRPALRLLRLLLSWGVVVCAAGCGKDAEPGPAWQVVARELDGALFSVAGSAEDDVWIAGANQGAGPALMHWDGERWTQPETGLDIGDLFWVHAFEDGTVYAAGTDGHILRGKGDDFEIMPTPDDMQEVWGLWGASPDDMWAVGGLASGGRGFVWRFDGDTWTAVDLDAALPHPPAWFKAWGTAADDVWFCGMDGALMHWDGSTFEALDAGTTRTLLTVNGRADGSLVTAVGGQFTATLVASEDGGPWHDVTPPGDPPLQTFGVFHRDDEAYAVGMLTLVLHHDGSAWSAQDVGDLPVFEDLHGVWIDPAGGVWAAGGQITTPPFTSGTLIYKGPSPPAALP